MSGKERAIENDDYGYVIGALDAAWSAAEEALPEGWMIWSLARETDNGVRPADLAWRAIAGKEADDHIDPFVAFATGSTPTAALRALAAVLSPAPTPAPETE